MRTKKTNPEIHDLHMRERIQAQALACASTQPWEMVAPLEIARGCGISYTELVRLYPSKAAIVADIVHRLDNRLEGAGLAWSTDTPLRDRLFDVVMERLDLANEHHAAHVSFLRACGWVNNDICGDIQMLRASIDSMAHLAGLGTGGAAGHLRKLGFTLVYVGTLWAWMHDTSPDLSKTMAQLDRALGRAQGIADYCGL